MLVSTGIGNVDTLARRPRPLTLCAGWFAVWSLFGLVLFAQDYTIAQRSSPVEDWRPLLLCRLTQAYVWALLSLAVRWLSGLVPIVGGNLRRAIAFHAPFSVVLALAALLLVQTTGSLLGIPWYPLDFWSAFSRSLAIRLPLDIFTYWLMLGFWEIWRSFEQYRRQKHVALQSELQLSVLKNQLAMAQLTALKNQLQPHFLFNTLNSIMALVRREETAPAELMLERLAELLRRVLRASDEQEVSLSDELDLVRLYLSIEQVRFQDRLQVDVEAEPYLLNTLVPNMCLQPLVENAIHHGLNSTSSIGKVRIRAVQSEERVKIEVFDNGAAAAVVKDRRASGIGLSNTRARLQNLYGNNGQLTLENRVEGGTIATVWVPFRPATASAGRLAAY